MDKNPDDLAARYRLGCCYAASSMFPEALGTFLGVLEKEVNYDDGAVKAAVLSVFDLVDPGDPILSMYRNRLANLLF